MWHSEQRQRNELKKSRKEKAPRRLRLSLCLPGRDWQSLWTTHRQAPMASDKIRPCQLLCRKEAPFNSHLQVLRRSWAKMKSLVLLGPLTTTRWPDRLTKCSRSICYFMPIQRNMTQSSLSQFRIGKTPICPISPRSARG